MFPKIKIAVFSFLVALMTGLPNLASADDLDIAQIPLAVAVPVKPALLMAIDNSGSMDSEVIFPTNDGALWWHTGNQSYTGLGVSADGDSDVAAPGVLNFNQAGTASGTWKKYVYLFPNGQDGGGGHRRVYTDSTNDHYAIAPIPELAYARSPAFNGIYFDPFEEYPPFPSAGSDNFEDADPEAAYSDVARGNSTLDLTQPVRRTARNWVFRLYSGMTIPAGTVVQRSDNDQCGDFDAFTTWTELTTEITATCNNRSVAIEYFPATFWLPVGDPLPPGYGFTGTPLPGGLSPNGEQLVGYEIRPANFATTAQYNEAIQAFANWFQYYRKRSLATRSAIGRAFDEVSFLRVGYFTINNRNTVTMRDLEVAADRELFFDWHYSLRGTGGTPNKQSVHHMGNQFRRAGSGAPVALSCQRNFGMLFTDGYSNSWDGAGVGNADGGLPPPLGDTQSNTMADIAYYHYINNLRTDLDPGTVPTPGQCSLPSPPLELNCNADPHMTLYGVTLGTPGLIFGVDDDATEDPWTNHPTWPGSFSNRHPSAVDDLWHATLNTRGELFSTTRPGELVDALLSVLNDIADSILPTGVAVSATRLTTETLVYSGDFDSTEWSGEFKGLDPDDGSVVWSAESELQAIGSVGRRVFTYDPASDDGIVFNASSTMITDRIMNPAPVGGDWTFPNVVDYVRGSDVLEEQNGGTFRDRESMLADIVNSRPVFSGRGNEGWARAYADYLDYIDVDKQDPRDCEPPAACGRKNDTVFIGANGGMLHAFDGRDGEEHFAYVPAAVHGNLHELADPDYTHRFFVDGQIAVADARFGSGDWRTVLVGGLGAGGRGIYALDVSEPQNFSDADVLWEFTHEDDEDLGFTYGEPLIARLENGDWVAVFGNGYNSAQNQAYLFVLDLKTGAVKHKIELGAAGGNGLSGVVGWRDAGTRKYLERVYAGDLNGTVWRVDFESSVPSIKYSDGLFTDPNARAITATPNLAAHPGGGLVVYFGTGKLIENPDRLDASMERFYALRDRDSAVGNGSSDMSNFAEAVLSAGPTIPGQPTLGEVVNSDGLKPNGWYVNLALGTVSGERVLAQPRVVFGRVIVTTYEPVDDPCLPGGVPRAYVLDALSGDGALPFCPSCGRIDIEGGAPLSPPITIRPQLPAPGSNITFPGHEDPEDPGPPPTPPPPPSGAQSTRGWCSEFGIPPLFEGGTFLSLGTICEGRQMWRQIR